VGLVGLGGSISVWSVGAEFDDTYEDNEGEGAGGSNNSDSALTKKDESDSDKGGTTEASEQSESASGQAEDSLGSFDDPDDNSADDRVANNMALAAGGVGGNKLSAADINGSLSAAPANGVNAIVESDVVISAGDDVGLAAYERIKVNAIVGNVAGGIAGVGAAVAVLNVNSEVTASLSGTINVNGDLAVEADGVRDFDYIVVSASFGFVGLGGAVVVINDNSTQTAEITDSAVVNKADSILVDAANDQEVNSLVIGASVGAVAFGASFTVIDVDDDDGGTVETLARIGHGADIGKGVGNAVGTVTVQADSEIDVSAETYAPAAGP
jgi:hypothetical protein